MNTTIVKGLFAVSQRLIVALAVVVALAACSSKGDTSSNTTTTTVQSQRAGDFSVSTQFAPDPPKQGPETITIGVKDGGGNAVRAAAVTIATTMPSMSMAGPTLTAADNGDGTYSAQTNLNYATLWTFDVRIKAGAKSGRVSVKADVK